MWDTCSAETKQRGQPISAAAVSDKHAAQSGLLTRRATTVELRSAGRKSMHTCMEGTLGTLLSKKVATHSQAATHLVHQHPHRIQRVTLVMKQVQHARILNPQLMQRVTAKILDLG